MGVIQVIGDGRTKKRKPIVYETNDNGCWICISHFIDIDGYPTICINWRQRKMSRYIYERFIGNIPKGMVIRHTCDTRNCINPNHLEIGTPKDNTKDMKERGREKKASGEYNGMAKLKWEQVREIRKDHRKTAVIARHYSVSPRCIRDIKNNINWVEQQPLTPDEIANMNSQWGMKGE